MNQIKLIVAPVVFLMSALIFLNGCSNTNAVSTVSYIRVIEKTMDDRKYWIVVDNPYDTSAHDVKLKTTENIWNLVKESEIYLANFEYSKETRYGSLITIKHPHEADVEI